jgi:nucleotide-binding universal stress UspA family protein
MITVLLLPIEEGRDGSSAIDHIIALSRQKPVRVYLLNVRTPLPDYVARFIPAAQRHAFHEENGMRAMRHAIERLNAAGIDHRAEVRVAGDKAEAIMEAAREKRCAEIVLHGDDVGLLAGLRLGSLCGQLRHLLHPGESLQIREAA